MLRNIYKDYFLTSTKVLVKQGLKEKKHLMWQFGGVPCIDADNVWEKWKGEIDMVRFVTDENTIFEINKRDFDSKKKEIDYGFGRQYYVEAEGWKILRDKKE